MPSEYDERSVGFLTTRAVLEVASEAPEAFACVSVAQARRVHRLTKRGCAVSKSTFFTLVERVPRRLEE